MSNHEREGNGDASLDRAWRQASDEQPPAQLDAAIVSAARKAIQDRDAPTNVIGISRRSRSWLTGWQPLAAAAGVAGLAFVLVQTLPRDQEVAPSIRVEEPASGPTAAPESTGSSPAPQAQEETPVAATAPASAAVPAATRDREDMKQDVPPAPPPPTLVPRAATVAGGKEEDASADHTAAMRAMGANRRQAAMPDTASQVASEAAAASAREGRGVVPLSAEDWAARVEALYASGDVAAAADALRAFRVADPDADAYLPEALRDWGRTVE